MKITCTDILVVGVIIMSVVLVVLYRRAGSLATFCCGRWCQLGVIVLTISY